MLNNSALSLPKHSTSNNTLNTDTSGVSFQSGMTHDQFQESVKNHIINYYILKSDIQILYERLDIIHKIWISDLSKLYARLRSLYSDSPRGKLPRDPVCMYRSLLVMAFAGVHTIPKWVKAMRATPLFAILSGFDPHDTPGVGTFYDFFERLCPRYQTAHKSSHNDTKKPKTHLKQNEKLPENHKGIVGRLVQRILKYIDTPHPASPQDTLLNIFADCFVMPSAKMGLIGDIHKLTISADGTLFRTGASHFGRKTCNCRSKGIYKCDCPRKFSDTNAVWGWDSYREQYVFGYSIYEIVATGTKYNLPIFSLIAGANRHDSVLEVIALDRAIRLYPQFTFSEIALDSAHDVYAIYDLHDALGITSIIALNQKATGNYKFDPAVEINQDGIPICKGGFKMCNWGYDKKDRNRIKWRCPHKCLKNVTCKHFPCSGSYYGRVVYTKPKDDKRLFGVPPRGSKNWNNRYAERVASERSFKRKKIDYNLEDARHKSENLWFIRTVILDSCQHIDAWAAQSKTNFQSIITSWIQEASQAA